MQARTIPLDRDRILHDTGRKRCSNPLAYPDPESNEQRVETEPAKQCAVAAMGREVAGQAMPNGAGIHCVQDRRRRRSREPIQDDGHTFESGGQDGPGHGGEITAAEARQDGKRIPAGPAVPQQRGGDHTNGLRPRPLLVKPGIRRIVVEGA